jgi:hypothetical protein
MSLDASQDISYPAGQGLSAFDGRPHPYLIYQCTVAWEWDSGLAQQPVAGPDGTPAKFVKLGAAHGRKVVRFYAERLGEQPVLPAPEPDTDAQKLLRGKVVPANPMPTAEGGDYRFAVRGVYVYGLSLPVTPAAGIQGPTTAGTTLNRSQNFLDQRYFSTGVSGAP